MGRPKLAPWLSAEEVRRTRGSWKSMRERCLDKGSNRYPFYGAKGITICERWNSFENFARDMGPRPPGTSLDRYPGHEGNYEPGNCRWATPSQQSNNRYNTKWLEVDGERKPMKEWAATIGLPYEVLRGRIRRGVYTHKEAVTKPVGAQTRGNDGKWIV